MSKLTQFFSAGETLPTSAVINRATDGLGMRTSDAKKALSNAVKKGYLKYVGPGKPGPNRKLSLA